MCLITSCAITKKDAEAIERGEKHREDYILKSWNDLIEESEGNIEFKSNFEALAWLLANNRLHIKIGFNIINDKILTNEQSKFHEKIAIYEDYYGDLLLLHGSSNETQSGYTLNREFVAIQEGWRENEIIEQCMNEFNALWNDDDPNSRVMEIPEVLKEKLMELVPEDTGYRYKKRKLVRYSRISNKESTELPKKELRKYQQDAIDSWVKADFKGILNMATGTGKTFTALNAIKQNCSLEEGVLLIVVPQTEIAKQWQKDCQSIFGVNTPILLCSGINPSWKKEINSRLHASLIEFNIVIAINNTFARDYFFDYISPYLKRMTIIVDEVHEIGAPKSKEKLNLLYRIPKRLGLSATPERMRDSEGNEAISGFFGGQVYIFTMRQAIYPPSGDIKERYLSPYKYYMHYSSLTSSELEKYRELTNEIKKYYSPEQDPESSRAKKYDQLCRQRSAIVKGSDDRLTRLIEILRGYDPDLNPNNDGTYSKCIIYCNTVKESRAIYRMLNNLELNAVEYHNDMKSREKILNAFEHSSFIRYIISIGCLDQGVDLPVCDGAIILSSTSNPRQYIQRRGRVLRTNGGKKKMAYIHDVIVTPYRYEDLIQEKMYLDDVESSIVIKQINRVETFIDDSSNVAECERKLLELKRVLW